jgi:CDP-diacylglycerol---serine O-phosphatidyltransferase
MKKVYFIPNIITALGLSCGLFVIFKMTMLGVIATGYDMVMLSTLLLLAAAFADLLDGAVARAMRAESEFGVIFDSLADAVSFGVAPSVVYLKSLTLTPGTLLSFFAVGGAMMYSLCGVLRLVRFNIKAKEAQGDSNLLLAHKKHFTGLPIPAAALSVVAATLFFASPHATTFFSLTEVQKTLILATLMFFTGYLMISRIKFPSSKALHFRVPSFHLMFLTVMLAIFLFYGILYLFPFVMIATTWSYIAVALTLSLIRLIAGKKSKTLEDFEPDEEDDDI